MSAARAALAEAAADPAFAFLKNKKLTLTIHDPNDRYPSDKKTLELVAQMWTQAFGDVQSGTDHYSVEVVAKDEPKASYFANAKLYGAGFIGAGIANGHVSSALQLYLVPGSSLNYGNYANDDVIAKYAAGSSTSDVAASDATLTEPLEIALDDFGLVPMFNPMAAWAVAPGYAYTPRADDLTQPHHVTKVSASVTQFAT